MLEMSKHGRTLCEGVEQKRFPRQCNQSKMPFSQGLVRWSERAFSCLAGPFNPCGNFAPDQRRLPALGHRLFCPGMGDCARRSATIGPGRLPALAGSTDPSSVLLAHCLRLSGPRTAWSCFAGAFCTAPSIGNAKRWTSLVSTKERMDKLVL